MMISWKTVEAHQNGDCGSNCDICELEDSQLSTRVDEYLRFVCCEGAEFAVVELGRDPEEVRGTDHSGDCDNYDGAPVHQWEVTEGGGYSPDTRDKHDPTL